jgi:hypothetical protein
MNIFVKWVWVCIFLLPSSFANAQTSTPFDGLYAPEIGFEGWECTSSSLGSDGGALGVMDGLLHGAGNVCELTKPTQVRGMNAVLYDAVCDGEELHLPFE